MPEKIVPKMTVWVYKTEITPWFHSYGLQTCETTTLGEEIVVIAAMKKHIVMQKCSRKLVRNWGIPPYQSKV